eukprot:TRINITY_DN543_c0_g1_i1.p1 TRINITY_DN543_c0_g1~~TRINITY_DN543_c0_g1_i1.p1  ORF type:complete len:291 (-),score=58.94 TRINITY_DN543_c0_g1_i1:205-1077(-)
MQCSVPADRPMSMMPSRSRTATMCTAARCLVIAAVGLLWSAAPVDSFVSGMLFQRRAEMSSPTMLRVYGSGPVPYDTLGKRLPQGLKKVYLKRMPDSNLDTEEMMKRITTVLLKNMEETFRVAPLRTKDLMKEIGLRGNQIKYKRYVTPALQLLQAQKVIYKVKQNPARWEIHEEYRKYGVPPVSKDKREPWKFTHLLQFKRTKAPKFGPTHGMYRPQDRDFLKAKDLPLSSIHDPILRPDPYMIPGADMSLRDNPPPAGTKYKRPTSGKLPRDEEGKLLQFDWQKEQTM